jgi:manganese/zinc/iron transport system permease protein
MSDTAWIICIAALVGINGAILGTFVVLRRMAMLGDAISHSSLLGIVVAFLVTKANAPLAVFISATISGVMTALIISFLQRRAAIKADASIGVTFTTFFALGVILISLFANQVDIDLDCVLFGEIAFAPLNVYIINGVLIGPRSFWLLLLCLAVNIAIVFLGYKKLLLTSFDPNFARATGVNLEFWQYLLVCVLSITAVSALDAVGAILLIALLVVPAAGALLVTKRLPMTIVIATLIAIISSVLGVSVADAFNASISASVALSAGAIFILIYLCSLKKLRTLIF